MYDKIKWSKEFVYYLGFLWADGSVYRNGIRLELIESDSITLINDFNKIDFIKFNTHRRIREGCKPQMSIYFCNSKLYDNFFSLYFKDKSILSPKELLKITPDNLKRYFYLGLIDGDGCFYISKNKNTQFSISSSFEQDWSHIEEIFKSLNIKKYKINRRVNKNNMNSQSSIRVTNYNDILKLSDYIYPNGYELGLKRKYDKCLSIINNRPKYTCNNQNILINDLIQKINELKNIKEVSKYFNCSYNKIFNYCERYNINKVGFKKNKRLKYEEYMTYEESKIFISKLNLKSKKEWVTFCKEGKRPNNIPSNPFLFYKNSGWVSYMDWLGYK
jgi:hypothetical protein